YAKNRFLVPALAPLVYNAGIIAGGLALGRAYGMDGFAWGVLGGSFVGNFAIQVHGARRAGLRFAPRIDLSDPGLKEFVRLSIPIMLGFSLVVVDEWMTRIFGSFLIAGAITWLNNARRLMQVPVGIFGQASGVASYPFLAAQAARGEKTAMWHTLSATLRWVFFVSCAAAAAVSVLSREVVLLVFKRGAFTVEDTLKTASALAVFAVAIPLWCSQAIVSRGFFALRDTWTPTLVGTGAFLLALPAYYVLAQSMGVAGLALASTAGIFVYAAALYGILMRRTIGAQGIRDIPEYLKMAVAALAAAFAGSRALESASRWVSWETFTGSAIRLVAAGAAVCAAYFLCALLLRCRTARAIHGRKDLFHPPEAGPVEGPTVPPAAGVPGDPPSTGS
ncbi:MAG: lipid II flippase MurJ, partial [Gemmatimonadota bacterium]